MQCKLPDKPQIFRLNKNNDVILYDGETLSISRNRKKDFLNDFFAHLNRNGGISQ